MKVRYNMLVGVVLVVLGAVCTFLGLWLLLLGEFSPAVIAGLAPLLIGVLYLARPYFWVHQNTVEIPAVFGPVKRRFPFQTLALDGGKVVALMSDGTRKKVPVARWMANASDWDAVMSARTTPGSR
jgi:hypothetical protein